MIQKIPTRESAVIFALVVVAVSGCLGTVSADDVGDESLNAMEKTDTYRFEMEMNMTLGEEMPGEFSVGMTGEGAVNESAGRMMMSSEVDIGEGTKQEVYVVNGTVYENKSMTGDDDAEWYKIDNESATSQAWNTSSPAGDPEEILEISDASHEGTETVDGESAHVLSLDPDVEAYNQHLRERLNGGATSGDAETPQLFGEDGATVEDASVRYWISDESGHVLRTQSDITVSFGVGGSEDERLSATVELETRMYDHGKDVSIELPEEARDASEFDAFGGGSESDGGGDGVDAGAGLDEIPDDEDVDRTTDEIVDRVEYETQSSEAFGETHTAKVYVSDSFDAENLSVEGLESGSQIRTDSPGSVTYLSVVGVEEGEEIAVTATKADGTVVRQTTTYEP